MHILVIGAGIVGLSTAWQLRRDGHRVTVIERADGIAQGASQANGAQLSYRYVAPLADPDVLAKIPVWMLRSDAPVRFRPRFDPEQWRWLARFLLACNASDKLRTVAHLLPLSLYSRSLVHELVGSPGFDIDHAKSGKLIVHRDRRTFASARALLDASADLAGEQQALDETACLALEPALASLRGRLAGGIYTPGEEAADCRKLCIALHDAMTTGDNPVRVLAGETVRAIDAPHGRFRAVQTATQRIEADACVVAAGTEATQLLRPLGIDVPLYPVKGYSITVPVIDGAHAPRTSITDFQRKIVYARLGETLRVAGMADIVGADARVSPARIATLRKETVALFGAGVDATALSPWAGLRPATPNGRPIIGRSGIDGVWLNIGHGALGLTLALGSAGVLADRIAHRTPAVPDEGFSLASVICKNAAVRRAA